MDGFKNIHESLEAGTAEGEIETGQSSTAQSGQEVTQHILYIYITTLVSTA